MKIGNLTINQIASICRRYSGGLRLRACECNRKCPFFMTTEACFLARRCADVIDDKIFEREIDPEFIKTEIDKDFYMNRFMEVN